MLILILTLILGSALVYISKYNFMPVTVNFGFYVISDIPLFYVIVASMVIGLVFSYLISRIEAISIFFEIRNKNNEIKKDKDEILELTKRIHQLELEKEKMNNGSEELTPTDQNAL